MRISGTGTSNSRSGFTLIELAVVLVILAVAVTLVLPSLATLTQSRINSNASRLATTVKALYNEAAFSGKTHLLVVNIDQGSYGVHRLVKHGDVFEQQEVGEARELGNGVRFRDVWLRGQGTIRSGEVKVHAYPVGWMDECAIHLIDADNRIITLHIPSLAGMADIYEEDRSF